MAVEEPDIEIGAGVSSKAISRRMQTDKSGFHGPRSSRDPPRRDSDRRGGQNNPNNMPIGNGTGNPNVNGGNADANPMPNFPFNFPMMPNGMPNGMPMIPPGFVMPGQLPPGQSS